MRSRSLTAVAVLTFVAAPVLAAEETVKQKPADDKKAEKADAAKPAEGAPAADPAECKPTATRVNTLEDLFGARDWAALVARAAAAPAPAADGAVLWRDETAKAEMTAAPAAASKPAEAAKPAAKPAQPAPSK